MSYSDWASIKNSLNSAVSSKDGMIYYTVSSTKYSIMSVVSNSLDASRPTGRVLQYDTKTGKNKVLLDRLAMANGIALSKNEDFLIVSESVMSKLWKIYLSGPKEGTSESLKDMPGYVDNIKETDNDTYLVGIFLPIFGWEVLQNSLFGGNLLTHN